MTAVDRQGEIGLDVLGRIGLRRGDEEVAQVLAQPKRFALLVYLALRRPRGFVRRDELLGTFWPESDEGRARASLRQALRFLRRHLGDGVVVNRGSTDVGIEAGMVACDAWDHVRALDEGRDGSAVDRYGGDLLPGFLLPDAYEFDRWLQAERQRLRTGAIQAALRLAADAEERGELEAAGEHVQWALRMEPTDEAVARQLISLHVGAGNRGAAVVVFEALEERLREELDLEPSPETAELIASVREGRGRGAHPGRVAAGSLSPQRVLVLGLENLTGDDDLELAGRLAAEAVAQGLATISELEVVPPMATFTAGGDEGGTDGEADRGEGNLPAGVAELARRTGAGTLVGGAYYADGDTLRFQARITDAVRGTLLEAPDAVVAPRNALLDAVEELRQRVVTTLAPALTRRVVHMREAARPPGVDAYRAYVEGLELFIRGEWRGALAHLRRCIALEPDYALPRVVSAIALWNLGELSEARTAALEAHELRSSFGRFERSVLDTVLAWLEGDWAAAHRAVRIQAEMAPGSIPHFQVAEEARRLNRPRETREVLSLLDPETGELRGWIFYWIELTAAHHLLGDHRRELEAASRCRRLHPDDPVATLLEVRALSALGRDGDVVRLLDEALATPWTGTLTPGDLFLEAALELRAHGRPGPAEGLLERALTWHRQQGAGERPEVERRDLARALYHAGRLAEARKIFEALAGASSGRVQPVGHHHGHLRAHLDEGYLAVIAAHENDAEELSRWTSFLEGLEGPFLYGAQWFWLAAVAALVGDEDRAVVLLRRAFAGGLPFRMWIHTDPHLLRLGGHPAFDSLIRPRG